ncbi:hypothetical protein K7432_002996 [Basidiobolus ranarum]|uniref:Uncharacterized protein n=1 Tax=Basidiobolus ranarum TaxID=34480 RepID=A0ABR2W6Z0_9FUNG
MPGDSSSPSPRLVSSSVNNNKSYRNSMQKSFAGSRTQQNRARLETSKISGPKPLNLPSLRREHATTPTVLSGGSWRTTSNEHNRQDSSHRTSPSSDSRPSAPATNVRAWASIVQVPCSSIADENATQTTTLKTGKSNEKRENLFKTEDGDEDKTEERNWDEMSDESIDFSVDVLEFADGAVKIDKKEDAKPSKSSLDPWGKPPSFNHPSKHDDNESKAILSSSTSTPLAPKSDPKLSPPKTPVSHDSFPSIPTNIGLEEDSKETEAQKGIKNTSNNKDDAHTDSALTAGLESIALSNGAISTDAENITKNDWLEQVVDGEDVKRNPPKELSWRRKVSADKCSVTSDKFENQYPHRSINTPDHHSGLDWRSSYVNGKPRATGQNPRNQDDFEKPELDSKRDDRWIQQPEESLLYDQDQDRQENCEPRDRMKYFQGENRRTPRFNSTFEKVPEKKGPSISDIDKIMSSIKRELSSKGTSIEEMKSNVARGPNHPSEVVLAPNEKEKNIKTMDRGENSGQELVEKKEEPSDGTEHPLSQESPKSELVNDPSYSSPIASEKSPSVSFSSTSELTSMEKSNPRYTTSSRRNRQGSSEFSQDHRRSWDSDKKTSKSSAEDTSNTEHSLHSQDKFNTVSKPDGSSGPVFTGSSRSRNETSFFSGKHSVDGATNDQLGINSIDEPIDPSLSHRKDTAKNWIGKERKLQFYSNRSDSAIEIDHSAPFTFGKKYLFSSSQDEEVLGGKSKVSKPSPIGEKRGILSFGMNLSGSDSRPEENFRNLGRPSIEFLGSPEDKQSSKATSGLRKDSALNQSCNVFPKEFESIAGKMGSVGFMVASEIISDDENHSKALDDTKDRNHSKDKQKTTSPSKSESASIRSNNGTSESRISNWSRSSKNNGRKAHDNVPLQAKNKDAWTNEKPISSDNPVSQDILETSPSGAGTSNISKPTSPLKNRDLGFNAFSKPLAGKSNFMYTPLPQEMGSPTLWVKPHPGLRMAQGEPGAIGISQVPMLPPLMDPSQAIPPRSPQQPVNTQYVQFVPLAMPPHQFMPPYGNMPLAPYPQMSMGMDEMSQAGWVMQPVPSAPMNQYHSMPNNSSYQYTLQNKRGHHHQHHERSPQQSFQRTPPYQNQHRPPNQNYSYPQQPPYSSKLPDSINTTASPRLPNSNVPPHFQRQNNLMSSNAPPNYHMYKNEIDGIQRNLNPNHSRPINQRGRGGGGWSGVNQRPSNPNYPAGFVPNPRGNSRNMY